MSIEVGKLICSPDILEAWVGGSSPPMEEGEAQVKGWPRFSDQSSPVSIGGLDPPTQRTFEPATEINS
jgi:hypothetical protein